MPWFKGKIPSPFIFWKINWDLNRMDNCSAMEKILNGIDWNFHGHPNKFMLAVKPNQSGGAASNPISNLLPICVIVVADSNQM